MKVALNPMPNIHKTDSRKTIRTTLVAFATTLAISTIAEISPSSAAAISQSTAETSEIQAIAPQNEVDSAIERLRASGMFYEEMDIARTSTALSTASAFGRTLFSSIVDAGGQVVLDEVLAMMGYNPDGQLTSALKDITSSIDALNAEVRKIAEQVEQILEGQDRSNFYNSYTKAGMSASNVESAMRSVSGWVDADLEPSEANLSDMQTVITTSISQLDFALNNPTTGTVPLMMKAAEPAGVSDLDDYWSQIDLMRDDYRAVLAQGLATLSLMERWDRTGTIGADIATFTPQAKSTVANMYGYGVKLGATRLHAKNTEAVLLPLGTSPVSGESEARDIGNRSEAEPLLQALAANYRASDYEGQTLESVMRASGLPTSINFQDTYTAEPRNNRWTSLNLVGRINGNSYEVIERRFGNTYSPLDPKGASSAFAQTRLQQLSDGLDATSVSVSLNVGGRASDFTPSVIEQAAFGLA